MASGEATLLLRIKQIGQDVLDRFVITFGDVVNIAKSVASALYATIEAFREEELAINQLTQSMVNQGTFTADLRAKYLGLADALEQTTTFSDDQIIAAQGVLQMHIGQREVTEELLRATLDLAAAKGMDLSSASALVGKAIASENDVLARHGIHVEQASDANQKMANVIDALTGKVGGQAAAMARGLGAIDQLKNQWSNFLESVGGSIGPFVTDMAKGTIEVLKFLNSFKGADDAKATTAELDEKIKSITERLIKFKLKMGDDKGDYGMGTGLINSMETELAQLQAIRNENREKEEQARKTFNDKEAIDNLDKSLRDQENAIVQNDLIFAIQEAEGVKKLEAQMAFLDNQLKNETNNKQKMLLLKEKTDLQDLVLQAQHHENQTAAKKKFDDETTASRGKTLAVWAAMQNSNNQTLAAIGKAAAITQIAIATPEAVAHATLWGTRMGGPVLGGIFAGLTYAAMAAQAAQVAGVQLAEGGIVTARPGGMQATIGEGGRDEAVIPLENGQVPGMGSNVTIIVNGGMLGDESSARQLAIAIDRQLLKLRQNNESQAFDTGLI